MTTQLLEKPAIQPVYSNILTLNGITWSEPADTACSPVS